MKNIFTPQVAALKLKGYVNVDQRRFGVDIGKKADLSLQHQIDRSSGCGSRFPSPTLNIDRAKSAVCRIFSRWREMRKAAETDAREEVMCVHICCVFTVFSPCLASYVRLCWCL